MAVFYTDTASLAALQVSGSSNTVSIIGSGSNIFTISSSRGSILEISETSANGDIFLLQSASIDVLKVGASQNVSISGSLSVTGSIFVNGSSVGTGGGGGGGATLSYFNNLDAYIQVATQIGQGSLQFQPYQAPSVQFDRIAIPVNYSNASNSSNSMTVSFYMGTYTRNVSTLSLASSISTSYNITNSGTVGSYSNYAGMRVLTMGYTNTLTEGQYYVGMFSRTTTGGGAGMTLSNFVASQINSTFSGIFGVASNASQQYTRGLGMYSATTNALPSSVGFNQLIGNSSAYLRPPVFYVVSNTY